MVLDVVRRLVERRLPQLIVTDLADIRRWPHSGRSRAPTHRQSCQLTRAPTGRKAWPNGQRSSLRLNIDKDIS